MNIEEKKQQKVSVIIPTYNSEKFINRSIDSVLKQDFKDYEIIIIDDGSKDMTYEKIKKYLTNKIKYIKQKNMGPASARNKGIKNSIGEYIAFLDSDDEWMPFHLSECIKKLDADNSLGLVFTHSINHYNNGKKELRGGKDNTNKIFPRKIWPPILQCTPATVCRKNILNKTGLFNISYKSFEDRDLWIRIEEESKIKEIKKVTVIIHKRNESLSSKMNHKYVEKNYLKIIYSAIKRKPELYNKNKNEILAEAWFVSGRYYYTKRRYKKALKYYKISLANKFNLIVFIYFLGALFSKDLVYMIQKFYGKYDKINENTSYN